MLADTPIQHPLERKQLKWLLVGLLVVVVGIVIIAVIAQGRSTNRLGGNPPALTDQSAASMKPTQEEIHAQLDKLAEHPEGGGTASLTEEEIHAQLDALAKTDENSRSESVSVQPTQEEIQKQLEALSR